MPKGHDKEVSKTASGYQPPLIKDARDVTNILLILDSQVIKTNPFGANVSGESSYKRAERISAALHLMTNHVPDTEPLRSKIRNDGLTLLSLILDLRSGFRAPASEKGQEVLAIIRQLISEVRLLAVSGFVSVQNASMIAEALDELGSLIVISQRSTLAEQMTLSREHLIPAVQTTIKSDRTYSPPTPVSVKRTSTVSIQETKTSLTQPVSHRAEQILEILKLGGALGIKDISSNLPQYSEKMIQRELAELVDSGKVQKTGEKRWSRYLRVQ